MLRTLKISLALRNAHHANALIYALAHTPLIRRLLPAAPYGAHTPKALANVLGALWELASTFAGKALYFLTMVLGAAMLYSGRDTASVYMNILFWLSLIGMYGNTYLCNPSTDKYYALEYLRMDARSFALTNYAYTLGKALIGMTTFALLTGLIVGLNAGECILAAAFGAGGKLSVAAYALRRYERTGEAFNENRGGPVFWCVTAVLLAAAYGLPLAGALIPRWAIAIIMGAVVLVGLMSVRTVLRFDEYGPLYRQLLRENARKKLALTGPEGQKRIHERYISADASITSSRSGFEYLNDLFIKRHRKLLWRASQRISTVLTIVMAVLIALTLWLPEFGPQLNEALKSNITFSALLLYALNRGSQFASMLFMNCDHSLLAYPFYREPRNILTLFRIRLREIIKVNLPPALILSAGLCALLALSGGADAASYIGLIVSLPCVSIFFSAHYLMMYYLLQPFTIGTKLKGGPYVVVNSVVYALTYAISRFSMPIPTFSLAAGAFCVTYCVAACIAVYRRAPQSFKLRVE